MVIERSYPCRNADCYSLVTEEHHVLDFSQMALVVAGQSRSLRRVNTENVHDYLAEEFSLLSALSGESSSPT
jgi:hypothetical protein